MEPILGFGAERFPLPAHAPWSERETRSRLMLARALNLGTVVAFIGSGCSSPLGYPTWHQLVKRVVARTLKSVREDEDKETVRRLKEIADRLRLKESLAARDLIFYLGFCQSVRPPADRADPFHESIAAEIRAAQRKARRDVPHNPYAALLDLPINRFITSNYDCELEQALDARKEGAREPFTQEPADYDRLIGFALAGLPDVRKAIF